MLDHQGANDDIIHNNAYYNIPGKVESPLKPKSFATALSNDMEVEKVVSLLSISPSLFDVYVTSARLEKFQELTTILQLLMTHLSDP